MRNQAALRPSLQNDNHVPMLQLAFIQVPNMKPPKKAEMEEIFWIAKKFPRLRERPPTDREGGEDGGFWSVSISRGAHSHWTPPMTIQNAVYLLEEMKNLQDARLSGKKSEEDLWDERIGELWNIKVDFWVAQFPGQERYAKGFSMWYVAVLE